MSPLAVLPLRCAAQNSSWRQGLGTKSPENTEAAALLPSSLQRGLQEAPGMSDTSCASPWTLPCAQHGAVWSPCSLQSSFSLFLTYFPPHKDKQGYCLEGRHTEMFRREQDRSKVEQSNVQQPLQGRQRWRGTGECHYCWHTNC